LTSPRSDITPRTTLSLTRLSRNLRAFFSNRPTSGIQPVTSPRSEIIPINALPPMSSSHGSPAFEDAPSTSRNPSVRASWPGIPPSTTLPTMPEVRARSDVLLRIAENQKIYDHSTPNTPSTIRPEVSIPPSNTLPFTPVSGWTAELQVHLKPEETTMRPASTNPSTTSRHSGIPSLNTIPTIDLNEERRDVVEENTDVTENRKDSADLTDDESVDLAPGSKGKGKRYA
jgi:hypothetical protein